MECSLGGFNGIFIGTATKDAELKRVGDKQTPLCSFSIATGKRQDTTTIFRNCKAWSGLAEYASGIRKGDKIMVVGRVEKREYNGKDYEDIVCDILFFPPSMPSDALPPAQPSQRSPQQQGMSFSPQVSDDDDLPF